MRHTTGWIIKMSAPIVVGIDIGTTKVCTLVARVEDMAAIHARSGGVAERDISGVAIDKGPDRSVRRRARLKD